MYAMFKRISFPLVAFGINEIYNKSGKRSYEKSATKLLLIHVAVSFTKWRENEIVFRDYLRVYFKKRLFWKEKKTY